MTKRIIDGMSANQMMLGWLQVCDRMGLEGYLESICKPPPDWKDDVSGDSPVLCYVGDSVEELARQLTVGVVRLVDTTCRYPYLCFTRAWKHAIPVSPDDCWEATS